MSVGNRAKTLGWLAGVVWVVAAFHAARAAETATELINKAAEAAKIGELDAALKAADAAVELEPKNPRPYAIRGEIRERKNDADGALKDYDNVIQLRTDEPGDYHRRAVLRFKLGRAADAVADFDKVGELRPGSRPYDWQRGIALYYAGRFDDGAKQFELHRTVNADDVENAAWHFLCVARSEGVEKARAGLIPIAGDNRVPMMKIHEMFAGKATPDDVIAEAKRANPPADQLKDQMCYAHLYIGLYYDATGDSAKAKEHIDKAAGEFKEDHYMGMVAQVHARLLKQPKPKAEPVREKP